MPTDPTTPDTEFSLDGGAYADCAEEVTTISGSNGSGFITLTGAETNGSLLFLAFKVASGPLADLATLQPRPLPILGSGTLSAGSAGGGTLGTVLAYDVTGCFIRTTGGTGGGGTGGANNQARRIVTYNVSTGAFTVGTNWETTPDATTTYDVLLPEGVTAGMVQGLVPTVLGRTLDVSTGGEAGLDWANMGGKTTTNALTNTTIKDVTDVQTTLATIAAYVDTEVAAILAAVDTEVAAIKAVTDLLPNAGALTSLATAAALATVSAFVDTEVASILAAVDTEVAAIKAVTDLLPNAGALTSLATAAALATVSAFVDTEVAAILAAVDTEVAAIKAKTDSLTFTVSGLVDANMKRLADVAAGVTNLDRSTRTMVLGVVDSGATTTSIPTSSLDPAASVADQFKGRTVLFERDTATAALRGQGSDITANTSGGTLTVTALTTAAAAGDTFVIV